MICVPPSYLLNVLDEETALRVAEAMQGCRIYFPKKRVQYKKIREDYENMRGEESYKFKDLSCKYEVSTQRIKEIVRGEEKKVLDLK